MRMPNFRVLASLAVLSTAITAFAADAPRVRPPRVVQPEAEECAAEVAPTPAPPALTPEMAKAVAAGEALFASYMRGEMDESQLSERMGTNVEQIFGSVEQLSAKDLAKMSEGGAILSDAMSKVGASVSELEKLTLAMNKRQNFFHRMFVKPTRYIANLVREKTGMMQSVKAELDKHIAGFDAAVKQVARDADQSEDIAYLHQQRATLAKERADVIGHLISRLPAETSEEYTTMSAEDRRKVDIYRRVFLERQTQLTRLSTRYMGMSAALYRSVDSARKMVEDSQNTIKETRVMLPDSAHVIVFSLSITKLADTNQAMKDAVDRVFEAAMDEANAAAERTAESINSENGRAEYFNQIIARTTASIERVREIETRAQGSAAKTLADIQASQAEMTKLQARIREELAANETARKVSREAGSELDRGGLSVEGVERDSRRRR